MIMLKKVAEILDENRLSVMQAATIAEVSYNTVYSWYTGRRTPGMTEYGNFVTKLYKGGYINGFIKVD